MFFKSLNNNVNFFPRSELYSRDAIRAAKRISNPGCYATAAQLLVAPLAPHIHAPAWPTVFGISGYSGAGTVPAGNAVVPKVSPESLAGGIRGYALTDHIHEREASRHLSSLTEGGPLRVHFTPSVAPWFSGILALASVPLPAGAGLSARDVRGLFEERYAGERLVRLARDVPVLADVEGRHGFVAGGFQVHSEGERVVIAVSGEVGAQAGKTDMHYRAGWTISSRAPPHSACRYSH
jgi:N-acetyl-gamma-glutamyl-phosphate reductase/acetylglutamate kinase